MQGVYAMRERLAKLIDVKSLVTFGLVSVVCVLAIRQNVTMSSEFVASIVSSIVTYYFKRKDSTL